MSRTDTQGLSHRAYGRNGAGTKRARGERQRRAAGAGAYAGPWGPETWERANAPPRGVEATLVPGASGAEPTLVTEALRPEPTRFYPTSAPAQERVNPDERAPSTRRPRRRSTIETVLRWSIAVVGTILLGLSVTVIVVHTTHLGTAPSASPSTTQAGAAKRAPTTTSPPAVGAVGVPELTSLTPSYGSAGQTVVVSGLDLFSPNGYVQASFGGQAAPTRCPTQTSCTVTVPLLSGSPRSVAVTVTTETGTSNALSFSYG